MAEVFSLSSIHRTVRLLDCGDGQQYEMPAPEDMPIGTELVLRELRERYSKAREDGNLEEQIAVLRDQIKLVCPTLPDERIGKMSLRETVAIMQFAWTGKVTERETPADENPPQEPQESSAISGS